MEELKLELDKDLDSITDVLKTDEMNPNARDNRGKVGRYANSLILQARRC